MTATNAEEIAYWNDVAGGRWVRFADRMDRSLAPFGARALAVAAAHPGEAVLDIGCGCGASSLDLAATVGPSGRVVGVDVSVPMLAVARARAQAASLDRASFTTADVEIEPFGGGRFDLAFSRFGIMFFSDPVRALANVRRALRPGGRLVFVCWRDLAANPWFAIPAAAVRPHAPPQPKPDPQAPGPLAFADAERVRGILERAGFTATTFEAYDAAVSIGPRADALELLAHIGPASRLLDMLDETARIAALAELGSVLGEHERDGVVALRGGVWIVTANAVES
jgi:SAM-dependent methyltransferase